LKVKTISIETRTRDEMINITSLIQEFISESALIDGIVIIHIPHTTAAVTINENADPDVCRDIIYKLAKDIPQSGNYHHGEGNSDAHVKSSLVGSTLTLIAEKGQLLLGTWQAVYFCEFDGPRSRKIYLKARAD
jgi:secondary thiamine-phosphate synthase enzyme